MRSVYLLTLRQLTGKWRLGIMAVLAAMPVIITVLMLHDESAVSVIHTCRAGLSSGRPLGPLLALAASFVPFPSSVANRGISA